MRLLMGLMLVAAMLATVAGPAMANHTERHEDRIDNRQDRFEDRFDLDFDFDDGFGYFTPFVFEVEDVEFFCDNDDGFDFDGFIECDDIVVVFEFDNDFDGFDFDGDGFDFDLE